MLLNPCHLLRQESLKLPALLVKICDSQHSRWKTCQKVQFELTNTRLIIRRTIMMMALLMKVLILLKPSHLEMKRSGALEYCKIKGRTGQAFCWYVGSG